MDIDYDQKIEWQKRSPEDVGLGRGGRGGGGGGVPVGGCYGYRGVLLSATL